MVIIRVICVMIIILFGVNKIIQISNAPPGHLAYILDFSNPSLIGKLFVISLIVLSIATLFNSKASSGRVEAKDKEHTSTSPQGPDSEASSTSSLASSDSESTAWYCESCDAEVSVEDKICPNCSADVSEVVDDKGAINGETKSEAENEQS